MALTGFYSAGVCHSSFDAASASFLGQFPMITGNLLVNASPVGGLVSPSSLQINIFGHALDNLQSTFGYSTMINFTPCDPALVLPASITGNGFANGLSLGLTLFLSGLAVWIVKKLVFTASSPT